MAARSSRFSLRCRKPLGPRSRASSRCGYRTGRSCWMMPRAPRPGVRRARSTIPCAPTCRSGGDAGGDRGKRNDGVAGRRLFAVAACFAMALALPPCPPAAGAWPAASGARFSAGQEAARHPAHAGGGKVMAISAPSWTTSEGPLLRCRSAAAAASLAAAAIRRARPGRGSGDPRAAAGPRSDGRGHHRRCALRRCARRRWCSVARCRPAVRCRRWSGRGVRR